MKPDFPNTRRSGRIVFRSLLPLLLLISGFAAAAPTVVTSIVPLYALATAITGDSGQVELLVNDGSSPHSFRLQPSTALRIQQADLLIWIGPDLESKLARPLQTLIDARHLLTVIDLPLPSKLTNRLTGAHAGYQHETAVDPHVWLDPDNAVTIANVISNRLAERDPANAARYRANFRHLSQSIKTADQHNQTLFEPLRGRRYAILHDALHYFEQHYHLGAAAALTVDSHQPGSAKRLAELKSTLGKDQINCILYEPMPDRTIVDVLLEGNKAHAFEIDPLGLNKPLKQVSYPELLEQLAKTVYQCLSGEKP